MREDQQDCQQQMMEIPAKVSDQVKKVENICSGSMPVLCNPNFMHKRVISVLI